MCDQLTSDNRWSATEVRPVAVFPHRPVLSTRCRFETLDGNIDIAVNVCGFSGFGACQQNRRRFVCVFSVSRFLHAFMACLSDGKQLEEAKNINKSLSALGNVIAALAVTKPKYASSRPDHLLWVTSCFRWGPLQIERRWGH